MRMLAVTITTGLLMAVTAGAALGATTTKYVVVKATGVERVSFTGDDGSRGTITHTFGGTPSGTATIARSGNRAIDGFAKFRTKWTTEARVTIPGQAEPCTDSVNGRIDGFMLEKFGATRVRMTANVLSGNPTGVFNTACRAPSAEDLLAAGALPIGTYAASSFTGSRISFRSSGSHFFRRNGFEGTVTWRLGYRLQVPARG